MNAIVEDLRVWRLFLLHLEHVYNRKVQNIPFSAWCFRLGRLDK